MSAAFHEDGAAGGEHEDLNLLNKLRAQNQYLLNIVGRQGEMIELLKSRIKTLEDER
jgi:hypothetical protein